ncbi:MAG: mechanosensitive ion channel family protein [Nitrospinota bacterium]
MNWEGIIINIIIAIVVMGGSIFLAKIANSRIKKRVAGSLDEHSKMIIGKVVYYTIVVMGVVIVCWQFGLSIGVLLGAAGIFSVAIGFAAQTSASNVISGGFLLWERPFSVGDIIKIGDTIGTVESIDLMATKLKTFDNLTVRMPNESIIKANITNLSLKPIRRVDIAVGIAYEADVARAEEVLMEVVDKLDIILNDPEPMVIFTGFGSSSQDLLFCAWTDSDNYLDAKKIAMIELKRAFEANNIEIPFTQMVVRNHSAE